jgi:hypothetical protein
MALPRMNMEELLESALSNAPAMNMARLVRTSTFAGIGL